MPNAGSMALAFLNSGALQNVEQNMRISSSLN